eukprot:3970330-Pleurochrysis_carterae.AAC.2
MRSRTQERNVAREVEQHVEDDVVQTLVAVEDERRGAKSGGRGAPQHDGRGGRGENKCRLKSCVRRVR